MDSKDTTRWLQLLCKKRLKMAINDLIQPSIEREIRNELTEKGEDTSDSYFL